MIERLIYLEDVKVIRENFSSLSDMKGGDKCKRKEMIEWRNNSLKYKM